MHKYLLLYCYFYTTVDPYSRQQCIHGSALGEREEGNVYCTINALVVGCHLELANKETLRVTLPGGHVALRAPALMMRSPIRMSYLGSYDEVT